jgi:predicted nucleic acid-binding Zn finger protein
VQTLSSNGTGFRTKLMDRRKAEGFAHCLRSNPRFADVAVAESPRAKSEACYFVSFAPSSEARRAAILDDQQSSRLVRALTEGADYVFCLDTDGGRPFFWYYSTSGEVYEVTSQSCDCPDFLYRCRASGLKCKHILALREGQGEVRTW